MDNIFTVRSIGWQGFVVSSLCILFILLRWKRFRTEKVNESQNQICGVEDIPGPEPIWGTRLLGIGNILQCLPFSSALNQATMWSIKYPEIMRLQIVYKDWIALISPELIQQLFQSTDLGHGVKSPWIYNPMQPHITNGLLVSSGKFWQNQRKILMKSQRIQNIKGYLDMVNKHSVTFLKELDQLFADGHEHTITKQINILFLRIICEMITGRNDHTDLEFERYNENFHIWKMSMLKRVLNPWLQVSVLWKLHPMSRTTDTALQEMADFVKKDIQEYKMRKENLESDLAKSNDENARFQSVLDYLVAAGVTDNQIVDEVNTWIFGGHETGATTLHFFCFMMGLNPSAQQACQTEVDELFANVDSFKNGQITYEIVSIGLKYVERCINETLRLYPPSFAFFRDLQTPLTLVAKNKTYRLPKGAQIVVGPYGTHRHPNNFPNPEKFDPDRFLPEEIEKRHPYAYIPFSGGQRSCPGQKFVIIELKLMIAYLLRHFEIRTKDKVEDVKLLPMLTLAPERDYVFELKKRNIDQ